MESNYEKQVYIARDLFLKYDQQEMIRKFDLKHDQDYFYLDMLDQEYRISRTDGRIEVQRGMSGERASEEIQSEEIMPEAILPEEMQLEVISSEVTPADIFEECLDYQAVMTICDVLCCSDALPTLAHEWCPLYSLQVTMSSPNDTTFTRKYAQRFSGRTEQLKKACQRIGGTQPQVRAGADVCWQFDFFPFFPVQMRFWDGDEEFEPKVQLLWDRNSLKFMHFETTYYAMGYLMERLSALLEQEE